MPLLTGKQVSAILERKNIYDPAHASRLTIIELHDPIPPPVTWWDTLKGIFIMKLAIFSLTLSGILVKYHYEYNSQVTVYDMVFVRAFS